MEMVLTHCVLRPWQPADAEPLVRHADNPNVSRNLRDAFPSPYTRADARAWIESASRHSPPRNVAIAVSGEAAGGIGLHPPATDVHRLSGEIGYWLGEAHWGNGIMTEAVAAFTRYAFETFGLVRIHASVFDRNLASARVLEKAGYLLEGRLRHAVVKHGELLDELIFATTRIP